MYKLELVLAVVIVLFTIVGIRLGDLLYRSEQRNKYKVYKHGEKYKV